MLHLKIFLSSPNDVAEERALALQTIERLWYSPALRGRATLEAVAWDKPGASAPMLATLTPQEAVNQGLAKPSECDIVVVILWGRMGTPLPAHYTKPDGGRYRSGTEWEYLDALVAAQTTGRPDLLVYRRTQDISLSPSDPEFMQKYEQWQQVTDFFAAFKDPDGSLKQGYNSYTTPETFRANLEHHLLTLIERRLVDLGDPAPSMTVTRKVWTRSPFPGLVSFTEKDAPIFFGRGRETDALVEQVRQSRFVAVVGASGSGKSSLVAAGLLPRLAHNAIDGSNQWRIVRFTPGSNPFGALGRAAHVNEAVTSDWAQLVDVLLEDAAPHAELLLYIDQFEELFTLSDADARAALIAQLGNLPPRCRVVLTLRADFYPHCVEDETLAALLRAGSYPLAAPKMGALHEMIARPADFAGIALEPGLTERILDDMGSDAGALALLAYTLDELYRRGKDRLLITHADYEAIGGVQGAIAQRADTAFAELDDDARAALPIVVRELVSMNEQGVATRRRARYDDAAPTDAARALIAALTDARLLVQSNSPQGPLVEVAHEALLSQWDTLRGWIEALGDDLRILRQLRLAVRLWQRHDRANDYLWVGRQLSAAREMIARLHPALNAAERDFVTPEQDRLLSELDADISHYRRAQIGERLAIIGDTRAGVALREDGLPDIVWCDVAGGTVQVIAREATVGPEARLFSAAPFKIAKYPVTYVQFRAFITDPDGFENPVWWEGIGSHRTLPDQPRPFDNHPVEMVSWYDAMAFSRWLAARLDLPIRLPTEWEWQLAASNSEPDQHAFPWGGKVWDSSRANTRESDLLRTTAVGMYPLGASSSGVMDLVGNIWEWCLNELEVPANIEFKGAAKRSVRGASCLSRDRKAIVSYRAGNSPNRRAEAHGFRLCLGTW